MELLLEMTFLGKHFPASSGYLEEEIIQLHLEIPMGKTHPTSSDEWTLWGKKLSSFILH
jgi:hypothetical protein